MIWEVALFGTALRWTEQDDATGLMFSVMIGLNEFVEWRIYGPDTNPQSRYGIQSFCGFRNWVWAYR
jgi:hypothetical protein